MKAAIYARVGYKDLLEPETDAKKKDQEFEIYCERLKQRPLAVTFRRSRAKGVKNRDSSAHSMTE